MLGNISLKDFILQWNLRFKYDRRFRKKYNIPFGSKQHLELNQIDIYLDLLEDREFEKLEKQFLEAEKNKKEIEEDGKFLKEQILPQVQEDKLFNQLRKNLNNV